MPQEETEVFVEDDSECLCLEYYRTYHKKLDKNCRDDCERQNTLHQAYEEHREHREHREDHGTDGSDSETETATSAFNLMHDNHKVTELALECAAVATDVALWATEYTATSGQVQGDVNTYTSPGSNGDHVITVYADNDHAKRDESSEYTDEFYHSVEKLNIRDRHVALTSNYEGHRQRALEYLDLSGCFQVTDLGIR